MIASVIIDRASAVALGTVAQFRVMGGAIGLAIVTAVFNSHVRSSLRAVLSAEQIAALLQSSSAVVDLPPNIQAHVRGIFAVGYNIQFKILAGFAAAQIPSSIFMWQKRQIVV